MAKKPSSELERFALTAKRAAELIDISMDTLNRYRADTRVGWIQGVHWFQLPGGEYRYNRELLEDWLANLHDPTAHQMVIEAFRTSLLSHRRKRTT
jgi:predicted site-specific integrase-resolvase